MFREFKNRFPKFGRERREGVLASIYFRVWSENLETDSMLTRYLLEYKKKELDVLLQEAAQRRFPRLDVRVRQLSISPTGSILIDFVIVAAGFVIFYGELRSGLDYLIRDIRWLLARLLSRRQMPYNYHIEGDWLPGDFLERAEQEILSLTNPRHLGFLIKYLAITNAVLITLLLAILVKALFF